MQATVFNIERFATEDGPGIRTVVFLKGCALRCRWCANPESQSFKKQVMFNANICVGCSNCIKSCPKHGIENIDGMGFITTSPLCNHCGTCVDRCYEGARSVMGTDYTVDELITELMKDKAYFNMSGGGVTFSGGEPCFYDAFIAECAKRLHENSVPVLIETCGHIPPEKLRNSCMAADAVFYDFKHINPIRHKELTGEDNTLILNNLEWLNKNFKGNLVVRYPYIPECNDSTAEIEGFLEYISKLKAVNEVWFLPYHRLGIPKYQGLGRMYEMGEQAPLKMKDIAFLKDYGARYGLVIKI